MEHITDINYTVLCTLCTCFLQFALVIYFLEYCCQKFNKLGHVHHQVLVEHGSRWKTEEDRLPLLEMYTVAILSYAEATPSLSPECEQSSLVLEKLGL